MPLCAECHGKIHGKDFIKMMRLQRERKAIAKANGNQIGRFTGTTIEINKSKIVNHGILKHSKKFNGTLNNKECMDMLGIAKSTFYKYVEELEKEIENNYGA